MTIVRRDALKAVAGCLVTAAVSARSLAAPRGKAQVTQRISPFELQGTRANLASLTADIGGYSVVRGGSAIFAVWLQGKDGIARLVTVDQRDALPMFEVFTLAIATADELTDRWKNWQAPPVPDDVPEPFRTMMTTRPSAPVLPTAFDPWPFEKWRVDVLRRAEFIVENVPVEGTVGNNPNMQSAASPMNVPAEASASCEVAVGVLFTGSNGKRLLMGVDWMPMNMVVAETPSDIGEYMKPCESIELSTYLERIRPAQEHRAARSHGNFG